MGVFHGKQHHKRDENTTRVDFKNILDIDADQAIPGTVSLKFVKRLKSAGFNDEQSEALSEAQRESLSDILDTSVSTKSDIAWLEKEIESLRRDVKELDIKPGGEMKLIKWMMGFVLAGIAAIILKTFFS